MAALVAAVVTAACTQTVPPISFSIMSLPVMPLSHLVDTEIEPIVVPAATGGKGTVTYVLAPAVPGLTFDPGHARMDRAEEATARTPAALRARRGLLILKKS